MEITKSYKTYRINDNFSLFIEKYMEKPFVMNWYRYGLIDHNRNNKRSIYGKWLASRPNAKRCINSLAGMIY